MTKTRIRYRPGAPAGVRRRLPRGGGHPETHAGSPRTLVRDNRKPWQHSGGNPEDNSKLRDLRRLPGSIAHDAVD
jgi:hypothetical protein